MYKAFVDGACRPNPGKGAYGYIFQNPEGREIFRDSGGLTSYATSNIAEYFAVLKALEQATSMGIKAITIHSDNLIVVNQIRGEYKVRDTDLAALRGKILLLTGSFNKIVFNHIPREQNRPADMLAQSVLIGNNGTRRGRADELTKNVFVKVKNGFLYLKEDSYYEVDTLSNICTCPDQRRRGGLCKHLMAAKTIEGKIEVLASF